jgi:hypothetical protein
MKFQLLFFYLAAVFSAAQPDPVPMDPAEKNPDMMMMCDLKMKMEEKCLSSKDKIVW